MKLVVVYNQSAGSDFSRQILEEWMTHAGVTVVKWIKLSNHFETQLAPYIKAASTVAVIGGDGTQRAVAASLQGTDAVMAPLPGGTLNHFAKDLGVQQDMEEAIHQLPTLKPSRVDVASVNDEIYVNNSSVGLYSRSLLEREKTESIIGKWPAAVRAVFRSFARFRRYSVTINGHSVRSPFIFIGNNTYAFQKSMLAERNSLNKGILTLFVLRSSSRGGLIKTALLDRFSPEKQSDKFIIDYPTEVQINAKQPQMAVSLDGEVRRLATPLTYKIHPKSLKVLV